MKSVIKTFWGSKAIRHLILGASFYVMAGYAWTTWTPSFFIRLHDVGTAVLGIWQAVSAGVFGASGTFL